LNLLECREIFYTKWELVVFFIKFWPLLSTAYIFKDIVKGTFFHLFKTTTVMRNILYIIAVILVAGWVFGAFFSTAGSIIHLLLVLAIASVVFGSLRRNTVA